MLNGLQSLTHGRRAASLQEKMGQIRRQLRGNQEELKALRNTHQKAVEEKLEGMLGDAHTIMAEKAHAMCDPPPQRRVDRYLRLLRVPAQEERREKIARTGKMRR